MSPPLPPLHETEALYRSPIMRQWLPLLQEAFVLSRIDGVNMGDADTVRLCEERIALIDRILGDAEP